MTHIKKEKKTLLWHEREIENLLRRKRLCNALKYWLFCLFQSHYLCNLRGIFISISAIFSSSLSVSSQTSFLITLTTERERDACFCVLLSVSLCQQVFLFCPFSLSIFCLCNCFLWENNAGWEEGDELEKGGQVPPSSSSSCLALLLHSFPFSQAWPYPPLLMVVSVYSLSLSFRLPTSQNVEMNQRVWTKF